MIASDQRGPGVKAKSAAVEADAGAAEVVDAVFEQRCRSVRLGAGGDGGSSVESQLVATALPPSSNGCDAGGDAHRGGITMRGRAVVLAAAIVMAPLGAQAADLVVWWQKDWYGQEDEAVREIIAAFEQDSGKQVDVTFHEQAELPDKIVAAFEAGQSPDFAFGDLLPNYVGT
jgi:hypothetical protein